MGWGINLGSDYGTALGYAGPLGLLAEKPQDMTTGEFVGNAVGGNIQQLLGNPIGKNMEKRAGERATAEEQARINRALAIRDENLGKLRALFGVGTGADAQRNQQTLAQAIQRYYNDSLQQNLGQAEQGYATTSRTTRQNLARVGQLGSGLDASAKAGTLSDFVRARQRAIAAAESAKSNLTNQLTNQRQTLENQIASGVQANPDFSSLAAQRDQTLASAQANIIPQQMGQLFNVAGNTYFNGRMQEAQGNQGLSAFGFNGGGSGSKGRVT